MIKRSIVLILLILVSLNNCCYSQMCLDLQKYNFNDDVKNSLVFSDFNLFLLGETHGLTANAKLQSKFFDYLNREEGVNNILIEWGRSEAFLINEYLRTGDGEYLRWTTFGHFNWKEEESSWEYIRENCSKSTYVYGIDFEREPSFTAAVYFSLDNQDQALKKALKTRLDTLKYSSKTDEIKKWIGDNIKFDISNHLISEILSNESSQTRFYERDMHMVKYFKSIQRSNEKYFGRFGTMHTQLDNSKVFAGLMKSTSKIIVVNVHYQDSWYDKQSRVKYSFLNDKGFFRRKMIRKNLSFFNSLSDCKDFMVELKPENQYLEGLIQKGQYLVYLTNKYGF